MRANLLNDPFGGFGVLIVGVEDDCGDEGDFEGLFDEPR
jgi:hypothetical protein